MDNPSMTAQSGGTVEHRTYAVRSVRGYCWGCTCGALGEQGHVTEANALSFGKDHERRARRSQSGRADG